MSLPHYNQNRTLDQIVDSINLPEGWRLSCRSTTGLKSMFYVRFNYQYEKETIHEEIGFPLYLDGTINGNIEDKIIEYIHSRMTMIHGKQWRHFIENTIVKTIVKNKLLLLQ